MKGIVGLMIGFQCMSCIALAQSEGEKEISGEINEVNNSKEMNMTERGLNLFLGKKAVRYLADDADVSLYKSFFIADIADGDLTLGRNFIFRKQPDRRPKEIAFPQVEQEQSGEGRITSLLTPTLKAKAEDNFSEIFAGSKFNAEIALGLKYTYFFKGSVYFNDEKAGKPSDQKNYMSRQRRLNLEKVKKDYDDSKAVFLRSIACLCTSGCTEYDASECSKVKDEFEEDAEKDMLASWYADEVESFDDDKSHNAVSASWISIFGNYSIVGTDLTVRPTVFGKDQDVTFKGYDLSALYTYMFDSRKGLFYFSGGGGIVLHNNIQTKQGIKKYDVNDYLQNQKPDTLQLSSVATNSIYVGEYREIASTKFNFQFVWLFPEFTLGEKTIWNKNFGLSLKMEKWIGTYQPFNTTLGVPLILSGKDPDKKINVEVQFKWLDLTKSIAELKSNERFSAGINLAIPFSSVLY